jgi:hypothetical protein
MGQYPIDWHELRDNGDMSPYYSPAPYLGGPTWDVFPVDFSEPGTHTVVDTMRCSGCPTIFMAQAQDSVQVCQSPYTFHNGIWTYDTPISHVTKTGALSAGQISIDVRVYTSTQLKFDQFRTWVQNRWNKTVSGNGVNLAISISMQRVSFVQEADIQVDVAPSNPLNPTDPDACGYHQTTSPHTIVVYADGDGQGCSEETTGAHEYGHHLDPRTPTPVLTALRSKRRVSWGNVVQWYHGRILWERY